MTSLRLPMRGGEIAPYKVGEPTSFVLPEAPPRTRIAYAAAHVVMDPFADVRDPLVNAAIDWDGTLAFRRHLWSWGLGVADAMDTAQRGSGLSWDVARELISRSSSEARAVGGRIVCGATTDQIAAADSPSLDAILAAYEEQCAFIESAGATPIVMASRHLARAASTASGYLSVYTRLLRNRSTPTMLHWLGAPFDPHLAGYWGSPDLRTASETLLELIETVPGKVSGVKLSVLDVEIEVALRQRFPHGVRLFTGDDFNFLDLIRGDADGHSDALLGAFDPLAPAAAAALAALDVGDLKRYDSVLRPTLPLARKIFEAPTQHYKTGVVLMAYLNGHQDHFRMVAGLEAARSLVHLAEVFVEADKAGMLKDPELAIHRMREVLAVSGVR